VAAIAAAVFAASAVALLARRRFGGFTGDTLGAVQQVSEIAILLAFLAIPS
jgi:adenosylcobinamide-GDP ribazoletransferase